jgi:hypothetical protein
MTMVSGQPRKKKGGNSNLQGNAAKYRATAEFTNAKIDKRTTKYNPAKVDPNSQSSHSLKR